MLYDILGFFGIKRLKNFFSMVVEYIVKSFKYCYGLIGIVLKICNRFIKKGVILCFKFK